MFDLKSWIEAHRWAVLGVLVGAALIGSGVFMTRTAEQPGVEVLSATISAELVVDIGGEVVRPGVYKLPVGSRIEDALRVAEGLTVGADTNYIEKYLNRAAKVSDGQKLYIPSKSASSVQDNRININSASQGELEGLPGIGPVTAGKIMAGRPYQNVSDLVEKKIVGEKLYDQIKDMVSVW
ncbi:MAG: Competence protein ComEA helix-hairpin-helix repeat protein [Candidatus Amesbacteria bacterium GW2011_GWA1_47_20]|uniref:Competence protein ComEA helix-hairpin-helix repeat protein n=1 Tax=Candidatus Amesbacteria bacterium GW2011_GWA1_47_20 TaxID=1618354 RepID=A0A0G1VD64_9BACT|nr:MAG: Competence protein ComEA helix-hairpin-helix repeat protein [Candidatus Amesbacteria bacterium GW2011_GWA1_47_20]